MKLFDANSRAIADFIAPTLLLTALGALYSLLQVVRSILLSSWLLNESMTTPFELLYQPLLVALASDSAQISGYLGNGDTFDKAIAFFAEANADQAE